MQDQEKEISRLNTRVCCLQNRVDAINDSGTTPGNATTLQGNDGSYYLSRSNQTGTQPASTISGLSAVALSGAYSSLSGLPTIPTNTNQLINGSGFITAATISDNYVPVSRSINSKQLSSNIVLVPSDILSGTSLQYVRGDGSTVTFPTNVSTFTNDSGYTTTSAVSTSYVPLIRTVNGKALNTNISLIGSDIFTGAPSQGVAGDGSLFTQKTSLSQFSNDVPFLTSSSIANKENTSNKVIVLDNSDSHYPSTSAVTSALGDYLTSSSAASLYQPSGSYVPSSRTINSKPLSSNLVLSGPDIFAGTSLQYVTGSGTLSTFPTNISTFLNDSQYTTQINSDGRYLQKTNNLSDVSNVSTARINLGLGSLSTQSGTFSGVSSGTNTGDETTARINSLYGYTPADSATVSANTTALTTKLDRSLYEGTITKYACKADARVVTDAVVTAGSTTLTSASANFTSSDIGKVLAIPYAGTATTSVGQTFVTSITSINSSNSVIINSSPVVSIVGPRTITDAAMSNNGTTLTSASANFTVGDVGKFISIPGAGLLISSTGGSPQPCFITNYISATQVTVSRKALATISSQTITIPGAWVIWGSDDTANLQNAINSSVTNKRQLLIETGRYLITSSLIPLSNMNIRGQGWGNSILSPVGSGFSTIQYLGTTSTPLNDVKIEDIEFDGMGVAVNTYATLNKALYMRPMVRPYFNHLYIHDHSATGLGCDFMRNYQITNCLLYHNGRQVSEFNTGGGGSGIGIGTGTWTEEAGLISGNTSTDNGNNGIFTESQSSNIMSHGVRMIGNDCRWNGNTGISDRACEGTIIEGNTSEYNGTSGIEAGQGFVAGLYSKDLLISNNQIRYNPTGILAQWKAGGLNIKNNIVYSTNGSTGAGGISITAIASGTQTILNIQENSISETGNAGIILVSGTVPTVEIDNNTIANVGLSTSTRRAAINSSISATRFYIRNNKAIDTRATGSKTGSYGFNMVTGTIAYLGYTGNDFSTMADGTEIISGTITTRSNNYYETAPVYSAGGYSLASINTTSGTIEKTTSLILRYREITAATTIIVGDYTISATSGTFTQPLPASVQGQIFVIANNGTGVITVTPPAGTIGINSSANITAGNSLTFQGTGASTGVTYIII